MARITVIERPSSTKRKTRLGAKSKKRGSILVKKSTAFKVSKLKRKSNSHIFSEMYNQEIHDIANAVDFLESKYN